MALNVTLCFPLRLEVKRLSSVSGDLGRTVCKHALTVKKKPAAVSHSEPLLQ